MPELDLGALEDLRKELHELIDSQKLPGYALQVTQHQTPVFTDCFGLADIDRKIAVDADTLFRQYSMTKAIVCVAAMTFFDEGRFKLDDSIADFLGDAWTPAAGASGDNSPGLRVVTDDGVVCGAENEDPRRRTIVDGDTIFIRERSTRKHIDFDPVSYGRCRWDDRGEWQAMRFTVLHPAANGDVRIGFSAHTGGYAEVVDNNVVASATAAVAWLVRKQQGDTENSLQAGNIVQLQHEQTGLWLCSKYLGCDNERGSLFVSNKANMAAEFILERQTWGISSTPALRPITMRNLMTHTSGLDYTGIGENPVTSLDRLGRDLVERCEKGEVTTLEAWTTEIAKLPLRFAPSTQFQYGLSIDVLGRVVEVLGNASLEQILHNRIFKPLGMMSTTWSVSDADAEKRLAALYAFRGGYEHGPLSCKDDPLASLWAKSRCATIFGAGGGVETWRGGLLSTVNDYMRFCHMLQGHGVLNGRRVLKEKTVDLMSKVNHLAYLQVGEGDNPGKIYDGRGWGLLGSIDLQEPEQIEGAYGWGGWARTSFRVHPPSGLAFVFMTNCIDSPDYEPIILRHISRCIRGRRPIVEFLSSQIPWLSSVLTPAWFTTVVLTAVTTPVFMYFLRERSQMMRCSLRN